MRERARGQVPTGAPRHKRLGHPKVVVWGGGGVGGKGARGGCVDGLERGIGWLSRRGCGECDGVDEGLLRWRRAWLSHNLVVVSGARGHGSSWEAEAGTLGERRPRTNRSTFDTVRMGVVRTRDLSHLLVRTTAVGFANPNAPDVRSCDAVCSQGPCALPGQRVHAARWYGAGRRCR